MMLFSGWALVRPYPPPPNMPLMNMFCRFFTPYFSFRFLAQSFLPALYFATVSQMLPYMFMLNENRPTKSSTS
jgi:hypothetical protein